MKTAPRKFFCLLTYLQYISYKLMLSRRAALPRVKRERINERTPNSELFYSLSVHFNVIYAIMFPLLL